MPAGTEKELKMASNRHRIFAGIIFLGASILTYRTVRMAFFEGALRQSAWWVLVLLFAEMVVDIACMAASVRWFVIGKQDADRLALRFAAAATLLHALRVLFFVLGRTGPWVNFDIRPEYRASVSFDLFWIFFSGILAALGVIAVAVIWLIRRRDGRQFSTTK